MRVISASSNGVKDIWRVGVLLKEDLGLLGG